MLPYKYDIITISSVIFVIRYELILIILMEIMYDYWKQKIENRGLTWILRCPTKYDAIELSKLRVKIDGETENLDRESGEGLLTPEDFKKLIYEDLIAKNTIFLVAEVEGKIVGFTRCQGSKLSRFRHKSEFGICISKEYWSHGIGKVLLYNGKIIR